MLLVNERVKKYMLASKNMINEIEALKCMGNGNILILVPRLIVQMTRPDCVKILEWHIREGERVEPGAPMLTVDFLQDDWYLPIPPLGGSLRVLRIEASVGDIVHLHDPLILLSWDQQSEFSEILH
jgi:hypothetical protein